MHAAQSRQKPVLMGTMSVKRNRRQPLAPKTFAVQQTTMAMLFVLSVRLKRAVDFPLARSRQLAGVSLA